MEIKQSNWFAAGPEVQQALLLLTDGAFRLYFYICLNASRRTGRMYVSYNELALSIGRSRRSIGSHLEELQRSEICRITPAANQHHRTEIEVCDAYWPYTKSAPGGEPSAYSQYLHRIRNILAIRVCVQTSASGADEKLAGDLFARHVPIEQIERAIALGCCRKYVSLLNGTSSGLIFSFSYFRDLIDEVGDPEVPGGYWSYVMPELEHLEKKWIAQSKQAADAKTAPAAGPENLETR